jgi:threonine synthase
MTLEEKVLGYRCVSCAREHGLRNVQYVCPACGNNLQIVYDYARIKKVFRTEKISVNGDLSIWRYGPLLPLTDDAVRLPLQIGWTPLYKTRRLGKKLSVQELYVKDDGRNPSASAKDRASAVVIASALERGIGRIVCASTGNAASSLACLSAPLGINTVVFVPASAPSAKIAQLFVFGAEVITVEGSYDQAYELSRASTDEYGWYNRNTGFNPFTREGKKTLSFEICEQLGWEPPHWVFVPVGDGNIISGVWKGFCDLYEIGFIHSLPKLVACQAEKSDAVKRAVETGGSIRPVSGRTVADSISVRVPKDGRAAVDAVKKSCGFAITVKDEKILKAVWELARETGVFAEPAGAVPLAALKQALSEGLVADYERIVLLATGNGLKDVDPVMKSMAAPVCIRPELEELKRMVSRGIL